MAPPFGGRGLAVKKIIPLIQLLISCRDSNNVSKVHGYNFGSSYQQEKGCKSYKFAAMVALTTVAAVDLELELFIRPVEVISLFYRSSNGVICRLG